MPSRRWSLTDAFEPPRRSDTRQSSRYAHAARGLGASESHRRPMRSSSDPRTASFRAGTSESSETWSAASQLASGSSRRSSLSVKSVAFVSVSGRENRRQLEQRLGEPREHEHLAARDAQTCEAERLCLVRRPEQRVSREAHGDSRCPERTRSSSRCTRGCSGRWRRARDSRRSGPRRVPSRRALHVVFSQVRVDPGPPPCGERSAPIRAAGCSSPHASPDGGDVERRAVLVEHRDRPREDGQFDELILPNVLERRRDQAVGHAGRVERDLVDPGENRLLALGQ